MILPIYDLIINEKESDSAEVSYVALVDAPAIKKDFIVFNEEEKISFAVQNEDMRIITGALMIPQQLIYRNNKALGEHYVKFTTDTIKQIAIKFAKKGYHNNVNLMHDEALKMQGVTMFESFISDSNRGIKPMQAFNDLPNGTWFGSFYVENEDVWQLVKQGKVKGFSVEGMFDYEQPKSVDEIKLEELKNILNKI